jgi:hypothetical protein
MVQQPHPFCRPLGTAIAPSTGPFFLAPWIAKFEQSLASDVSGIHDAVSMPFGYTFPFPWYTTGVKPIRVEAGRTAEQKGLADLHKFVTPECFAVENVGTVDFCSDSASQVFNCFAGESTINGSKVSMCFCVCFLQ